MKRILATFLAGSFGALTLAIAPARAEERREDRTHDRRDRNERDGEARRDHDRYDGYDPYGHPPPPPPREPVRHASVEIATGTLAVRIDVGGWLAPR